MAKKDLELPDYWSVYKAINKHRINKSRDFTDAKTGKKMTYEFVGAECLSESIFMQIFAGILWFSPVLLIILISILYLSVCSFSLFIGIFVIIAYHFAAMYYIIRGPHLIISHVKKKSIFSRK